MTRWLLMIAGVVGAVACAQIAGFEEISGREGSGGSASQSGQGGGGASAGTSTTGGSAPAGAGSPGGGQGGKGGQSGASAGTGMGTGGVGDDTAGAAGMQGIGARRGCNEQLLINGDFDQGPVGWEKQSEWAGILTVADIIRERDDPRLLEEGVEPYSGDYLAWLGGVPDTYQSWRIALVQNITLPIEVTRLVLTVNLWVKTGEEPDNRYDQVDFALASGEDEWWSLRVWDNRDADDEWMSFEVAHSDNLDFVRGREFTFIIESLTDSDTVTHFWLDSVKFVAECGI